MKDVTLTLSIEEVNAIMQVLGDLPTKSGAYPLVLKINEQVKAQVEPQVETE
jgi:hypothetical protein